MKRFVPLLFLLTSFQMLGQQHVEWTVNYDSNSNQLIIESIIDQGWHIYSQDQDEAIGPIATSFEIKAEDTVIRRVKEPAPIVKKDPNFGGELMYLEGQPQFKAKLPEGVRGVVTGEIVYMSCNEEGCLPPKMKKFKLIIK